MSTSRLAAADVASSTGSPATREPIEVTTNQRPGPGAEEQRLRELTREAARHPDDAEASFRLALFATVVGAYEDAIDAFHRTLALQDEELVGNVLGGDDPRT